MSTSIIPTTFAQVHTWNNKSYYILFLCPHCHTKHYTLKSENPSLGIFCVKCNTHFSINSSSIIFSTNITLIALAINNFNHYNNKTFKVI